MYSSEDEFPGLSALGLYAAETDGDGKMLSPVLVPVPVPVAGNLTCIRALLGPLNFHYHVRRG